jgi:hypothetical protein
MDLERWITTNRGAELTGYSAPYIRRLARTGQVLGRKVGRDWLVQQESLLAYKRAMDALGPAKHNPWREDLNARGRGRRDRERGQ